MDEGLKTLLWIILFIIPIILLLWSWVFGSRIGDEIFSKKYLKESFDVFKYLLMFYFGAVLFIIAFFFLAS